MLALDGITEEQIRDLTENTEVSLGPESNPTVFVIEKMPARPAHRVWRETVHALGKSDVFAAVAAGVASGSASDVVLALHVVRGLLTLDVDFLDRIQAQIFEFVRFTNANVRSPQKVTGAEDTAVEHLDPYDIDELFVRAFAVNFTPSLRKIGSKLNEMDKAQSSPNPSV